MECCGTEAVSGLDLHPEKSWQLVQSALRGSWIKELAVSVGALQRNRANIHTYQQAGDPGMLLVSFSPSLEAQKLEG